MTDHGATREDSALQEQDGTSSQSSSQVLSTDLSESQRSSDTAVLAPPPLPSRPSIYAGGSLKRSTQSLRPSLQSTATTALSLADVHTQTYGEAGSVRSSPVSRSVSRKHSFTHFGKFVSNNDSDGEDSASQESYVPTLDVTSENDSALGGLPENAEDGTWRPIDILMVGSEPFEAATTDEQDLSEKVQHEFDSIDETHVETTDEEATLALWKDKLKHFFILSASGKPIYSRHGTDALTSHYIGVAQTLIAFFEGSDDALKGFIAGETRFVILSKGPLNLVAISRLGESEAQLRNQLESLYMQILSTLTLPAMEKMFIHRPSTDLRRPLQGTDTLLDGLADGFTRGSPSTLLSALECLRLRKTHRRVINDSLLKVRSPDLLYGLIVAAGRLVSVVRPKKHSLHPGDLHLIFNMLFEAGSVKAGGGENWIPLCLPGFNNTGFLYMYVSFFSTADDSIDPASERPSSSSGTNDELAIVLISANKEAFYSLRTMRENLVTQLDSNGSMSLIKAAIRKGHSSCNEIVPGTIIRHFLYKSRGNVQFVMPSLTPQFEGLVQRRKLMTLYHQLHESIHTRTSHLKIQHVVASDAAALAWETPLFELYCVAGPQADRTTMTIEANKIVQWISREEERVFIIGGAVF